MARIVFAGYLVRFPVGGYAWQTAHYLLGLRALGNDVWLYEDTGIWDSALAYNPVANESGPRYDYGLGATAAFLDRIGFGDRWVFVDVESGAEYGPGAGRYRDILDDSDLLISFGAVNRLPIERWSKRPAAFIDADPVYNQLKLAGGDRTLGSFLDEHTHFFTFGENISTSRSTSPTGGYTWLPTRQPIAIEFWHNAGPPGSAYTTIGTWNSQGRDLTYQGQTFEWRKRTEWLRCVDLPGRTAATFEVAMDVASVPGDAELLAAHRWRITNPLAVSTDPWRYREYIRGSRGEFSIAKAMPAHFRSGWFSDRAACYLAAGRPVVEGDTGFGDVLPCGPGLHAFRTVEEAAYAISAIESDYERAATHASAVAREFFAADRVLGSLLKGVGL